jgi:TatD DNase family protein
MSDSAYIRQRDASEGGTRKDLSHPPLPEPLPVAVYDNHTHLEIADGDEPIDYRVQLERAAEVGVIGVVQVGTDLATSKWSAQMAAAEPRILAAVALHPNDAPEVAARGELHDQLAVIDELASWPRTRAVGETGLDFFRTGEDGRAAQFESFEAHIEIAKKHGVALQIHDRDAHDEVIATLLRVGAPEKTVFHCFSGDLEMAKVAADHGWYLSFSGTFTFKKNDHLREALAFMPSDRVLVETDAPFLTPVPFRGRPNASYLTPHTVRAMAEYLAVDLGDLCADLALNTETVYGSWNDGLVTDSAEF